MQKKLSHSLKLPIKVRLLILNELTCKNIISAFFIGRPGL